jgi:hypothetical protein
MPLIALGIIYNLWFSGVGLVLLVGAMYGWSLEPATDPDAGHGHEDHGHEDHPSDDGGAAAVASAGNGEDAPENEEAPVG